MTTPSMTNHINATHNMLEAARATLRHPMPIERDGIYLPPTPTDRLSLFAGMALALDIAIIVLWVMK